MRALPFLLVGLASLASVSHGAEPAPTAGADGSMALPPFTVPYSTFTSPKSLTRFHQALIEGKELPSLDGGIEAARRFYDKINSDGVGRMKKLYPVRLSTQSIAGVDADVAEPAESAAPGENGVRDT